MEASRGGCQGHRAELFAARVAKASAALDVSTTLFPISLGMRMWLTAQPQDCPAAGLAPGLALGGKGDPWMRLLTHTKKHIRFKTCLSSHVWIPPPHAVATLRGERTCPRRTSPRLSS